MASVPCAVDEIQREFRIGAWQHEPLGACGQTRRIPQQMLNVERGVRVP